MANLHPKPKRGTCVVCGCTDARACPGGCWWVDEEHTLCSTCAGLGDQNGTEIEVRVPAGVNDGET